jgi:hypothetical protein
VEIVLYIKKVIKGIPYIFFKPQKFIRLDLKPKTMKLLEKGKHKRHIFFDHGINKDEI